MFNKLISLNIFCAKVPYKLTILNNDCVIIKNKSVNSNYTRYCICTTQNSIKVSIEYNNIIYFKKLYLYYKHQTIYFMFNMLFPQMTSNAITLIDKTYGFPVKKALLNFKQ